MVTDQEIAKGVETVLRQADPSAVTSLNGVVQQLEAKLGLDLSHKAAFIRDQINLLLRSHPITTSASATAVTATGNPPPQQQAFQFQQGQALNLTPKDHFALQFQQQFSPSHFALHPHPHPHPHPHHQHHPQQHHQHQVFSQDLNFRQPQAVAAPPAPSPQQQQHRQTQQAQNVGVVTNEVAKESRAPVGSKRRGGPGGLNKVCGVSPELQAIVGEPALPRTEIVKQLWQYIRKNNLQDPSNKRKIICDDALRVVFETDCTDMFKMNKLLAKHIIPLQPSKESSQAKRAKVDVEITTENTEPGASLVVISERLAEFLGTAEREMTQTEASRRVWEYIKLKQLEDPLNSMAIQCDTKLRDLLGCESEDVHFSYPLRPEVKILNGLNLTLKCGTVTALVGSSGSGKSTIVQLLARFYEPTKGRITVSGEDVRTFEKTEWVQAISIVNQEPVLFSVSVGENIAYGLPDDNVSKDDIIKAAKAANAHEFIISLPQGYDTLVGERGGLLSGGQRQRIAIARALLKNAPILILDEATSALDAVSERLVQDALDQLMKGRTTLVIAHRLSTVQNANQIALCSGGRIAELGTHFELLDKKGQYASLFGTQRLAFE